jgi:hypothetical protein
LEARELKTAGISLGANGMVVIVATQSLGNSAAVRINSNDNSKVDVTLNGNTAEFDRSQVTGIVNSGGIGGGNTFTGGSGQDYMFLWGDGNTVQESSGGFEVAFTHGGHDTIDSGILTF